MRDDDYRFLNSDSDDDEEAGPSQNTALLQQQVPFALTPGAALHQSVISSEPTPYYQRASVQLGLSLLVIYSLSLIIYLEAHGTQHWAEYLDAQYTSDGAPASDLQRLQDQRLARMYAGFIFGLTPLLFIATTFATHVFVDGARNMRHYRAFTRHTQLPAFNPTTSQARFLELKQHSAFLLKEKTRENGSRGFALLLCDLAENRIAPAPQHIPYEAPARVPTEVLPQETLSHLARVNQSLATHHAALELIKNPVDAQKIVVSVLHGDATVAIHALRAKLEALERNLGGASTLAQGPQKEFFLPLLVLAAQPLYPSIKARVLFATTLLEQVYLQQNSDQLGELFVVFFNACLSETLTPQKKEDIAVYQQLTAQHKAQLCTALTSYGAPGELIARHLTATAPVKFASIKTLFSRPAAETAEPLLGPMDRFMLPPSSSPVMAKPQEPLSDNIAMQDNERIQALFSSDELLSQEDAVTFFQSLLAKTSERQPEAFQNALNFMTYCRLLFEADAFFETFYQRMLPKDPTAHKPFLMLMRFALNALNERIPEEENYYFLLFHFFQWSEVNPAAMAGYQELRENLLQEQPTLAAKLLPRPFQVKF